MISRVSSILRIVALSASCLTASVAFAQSDADLHDETIWTYPTAGAADIALVGASLVTVATARLIGPSPGRWQGGILADDAARDFLKLNTRSAQHTIEGLSDVSLALTTAMPMFDSTIIAIGYYRDPVAARQIAILNGEVVFMLAAMQTLANSIASRERPYGRRCGDDLSENLDDCVSRDRHYSFFSGHSAQSFGAAALTCGHHMRMKLYGGGFAEVAQCIAGFSLATFTATARVMADKHYLSDVMTGAFFGTLTGFGLPYLMRFRKRDPDASSLRLMPTPRGLSVGGTF